MPAPRTLAVPVGAAAALVAVGLLKLIALITNLSFLGRAGFGPAVPGDTAHRWLLLVMPVIGGLVIGVMARYGSDKIRGHGMPEAIESILVGGSRVQPRVAVLKPTSAAISIGTGGPFGAEGPIIMTGGAVGSLLAQLLRVTADERKALLVTGSAKPGGGLCRRSGRGPPGALQQADRAARPVRRFVRGSRRRTDAGRRVPESRRHEAPAGSAQKPAAAPQYAACRARERSA
ncbi:chloride channel protein [Streptomyces sp. NPDC050625]|uniref:chloride channel protein n=1 Tax=Streptomyces sp. NPDC050625 TaxID=3154629 RepID=UPI003441C399